MKLYPSYFKEQHHFRKCTIFLPPSLPSSFNECLLALALAFEDLMKNEGNVPFVAMS